MTALYMESAGRGPPVVLVHAGIADLRMWDPQWETFPRAHHTLRLDLPGYGRSPAPDGPAAHAASVLETLPAEPVALVGASFGARVALEVAVAAPERVSALVLAAPPPGDDFAWSGAAEAFDAAEAAALERGDLEAAVEVNLDTWLSPNADPAVRNRLAELTRAALQSAPDKETELVPDLDERLVELRVPTLVLVGEHDLPDFHAFAGQIATQARNARALVIPEAGHLPSLERPREFDTLALGFLSHA